MKRILSTLLVLFMCLGITACGNSSQKKTEIRDVFQMNPVMLDENFMGISAMRATENAVFLLGAMQNEDSDSTAVAKYDLQQESVTYTPLSDIEYASNFAASDDMLVFLHTSYDELGEKVFASSYDNDGKPLWRINITESIDSEVYVDEIYAVTYGSVCYLGIKDTLFMITEDGNNSIMRKFESTITGLFKIRGNIHVYGLQYHYVYYPESGQYVLSEEWQKGLSEANGRNVYFTNEGDGFHYITEESLNKYNIQNGDCLTVMNWVNSGIAYSDIYYLSIIKDDLLFLYGKDIDGAATFWKCQKADEKLYDNREIITISYIETGRNVVPTAAVKFNAMQDEYFVICEEYTSSSLQEAYKDTVNRLSLDIAAKNIGDIIVLSEEADANEYARKGVFADLYTIGDDKITPDNIFGCVKEVCEWDGKLYILPQEFKLDTCVIRENKLSPDETWNLNTFMDMNTSLNDAQQMFVNMNADYVIDKLMPSIWEQFVDTKTKTCDFVSDDFIRVLHYIESLPTDAAASFEYGENPYITDAVMLYETTIGCYGDYAQSMSIFDSYGEGKFVGYPSSKGGLANVLCDQYFAINNDSKVKEGAIDFLSFLFSKECVVKEARGMRSIPSLKSTLEGWRDSETKKHYYFYTYDLSTYNLDYSPISAEAEGVPGISVSVDEALIDSMYAFLDAVSVGDNVPTDAEEILREEISAFLGGVRDANMTADMINKRVGIYLNKQR